MRKYAAILGLLLASCSPKIVEKVHTEYVVQTVHHRDTTVRLDSVYIKEYIKGDTVFVDKFRDRYVFRDRWRDSVRVQEVHDTTAVEVPVEKELTVGQKAKIGAFPWLVLAVAALLVWTFRKQLLRMITK